VIDRCTPLPDGPVLKASDVAGAMEHLRSFQPNFSRTGGIHAAAVLDAALKPLSAFEDIGRHNALDKVVGSLVLAGKIPGTEPVLLLVSGRASFEVVQKAAAARIPVVASVSAASSLAIDLAKATGVTLCGFVRNGAMTVYSHPARLR
jgi:FdhD protein